MVHAPEDRPRKRWGCAAFLLVVAVLVLGGALGPRWWWGRQLEAALDELEGRGFPRTMEGHLAAYRVPEGETNAAELLLPPLTKLWEDMQASDQAYLQTVTTSLGDLGPEEALPEALAESIEQLLAPHGTTLGEIRAACAYPHATYPVDTGAEPAEAYAHLRGLHLASRLLRMQAVREAHRGNADQAAALLIDCIALAETLRAEPFLESLITRSGLTALVSTEVLRLLHIGAFHEAQLARLAKALAGIDLFENLPAVLHGHTLYALQQIDALPAWEMVFGQQLAHRSPGDQVLATAIEMGGFRKGAALALVRGARDLANRFDDNATHTRLREIGRTRGAVEKFLPDLLSGDLLLAEAARKLSGVLRNDTELEMVRAVIAIERFRLQHVALPDSLDALVPRYLPVVPADPMGDGPLLYHRDTPDYLLYSVGVNGEDDGGHGEYWSWYRTQGGNARDFIYRASGRR